MKAVTLAASAALAGLAFAFPALAADWFPYKAEAVDPPFSADGKVSAVEYVPLERPRSPGRSASPSRT